MHCTHGSDGGGGQTLVVVTLIHVLVCPVGRSSLSLSLARIAAAPPPCRARHLQYATTAPRTAPHPADGLRQTHGVMHVSWERPQGHGVEPNPAADTEHGGRLGNEQPARLR